MTKERIIDILRKELGYIYCDSCLYEASDSMTVCDGCHRKSMMWEPSEKFLERLAKDIICVENSTKNR